MDYLTWRVAARHLTAERVGDPKELLGVFEHAVKVIEAQIPEDQIIEAKHALGAAKSGVPAEIIKYDGLALKAFFTVKHAHHQISGPGHKLFLSILQTYVLPPALRKKIEIASRVYLKDVNPRIKAKGGADFYLERIEVWEKFRFLLRSHVQYAKEAIAHGKEHAEEGEGATKMRVGPFTLVNTGGFDGKQMDEVADVVQKATAYAQSAGLGDVCYGEVQVTNTIHKANVLAFYLLAKDEMFIRANVKATTDVVRTVLHELGHRYQHKFMPGRDRDVERLYHELSGQEIRRKYDTTKVKLPQPGETMEAKGKTYVVTRTLPDLKSGYKVYLHSSRGGPERKGLDPS